MGDGRITRDQPRPHYKWGGSQRSPILGDSIMWTPFVVKRSNIIRGKLVIVTHSSQGAVGAQRSTIFGLPLFMSTPFDVERQNSAGSMKVIEGLVLGQPFIPRLMSPGTPISGNRV